MEPLFTTTVNNLVIVTEARIAEIEALRDKKRAEIFKQAKECDSYEKLRAIMDSHREYDIYLKLNQYTENLEYLRECDQTRLVFLNQTEWRHYFHGAPRPELC